MFNGFTDATIDFMWNLRFNNERPWFNAHKEEFLEVLDRPMKALAAEVLERLQAQFPERTWYLHVSRIYRDARRLYGHGPYKDHLWFTMRCDASRGAEVPAFFFELSPENYGFGMGFYWASADMMERYRRAILGNPRALEPLAERLNAQDTFALGGKDYARPKGDVGELLNPWFNKRVLDLSCMRGHDDLLFSPALVDALVRGFAFLVPYYDYLDAIMKRAD